MKDHELRKDIEQLKKDLDIVEYDTNDGILRFFSGPVRKYTYDKEAVFHRQNELVRQQLNNFEKRFDCLLAYLGVEEKRGNDSTQIQKKSKKVEKECGCCDE